MAIDGKLDTSMIEIPAGLPSVASGGTKIQSGIVNSPGVSSGTTNFPVAFATAPVVIVIPVQATYRMIMNLNANPTTTGFVWGCKDDANNFIVPAGFHWIAIGT